MVTIWAENEISDALKQIERKKMKIILLSILLTGCFHNMDYGEIRAAEKICTDQGKEPVQMQTLSGQVRRVECW